MIGRVLLGAFFLFNGVHHFMQVSTMAPFVAAKGIPVPTAAVIVAGLLLLVGGVTLLLGIAPLVFRKLMAWFTRAQSPPGNG